MPPLPANLTPQNSISPIPILPSPAFHVAQGALQRFFKASLSCSLSATLLISSSEPAIASIPLSAPSSIEQQRKALGQLGVATKQPIKQKTDEEPVSKKVERVMALMAQSSTAAEAGDFATALNCQTEIIQRYPDLALAERARIARALLYFQVGRTSDALLQLEDEEVVLRGSAEVHAALAVIFYSLGKPVQAEQQWTVATEFDSRYSDINFVKTERHWPPKLVESLEKFLTLS